MSFSSGKTSLHPSLEEPPSWQVRALERSTADARARSVARLSQFVAAARALATETGSSAFTVKQVVAESGQSLKSFYRYFEGKDDLLLALLEEDSAVGALFLQELVDAHRDPVARIREWMFGLFELMAAGDQGYVAVLVREYQHFVETRPAQIDVAVAPFISLLAGELERGREMGVVRPGDSQRDARLFLSLVLVAIREIVSGRDTRSSRDVAAYLWQFCWGGLRGSGGVDA
jgi:AcrR family transcriptional regulator